MILPDAKARVAKSTVGKILDFFLKADTEDPAAIAVPVPTAMRSFCMGIHLQPTRDILLKGTFKIRFQVAVDGCVSLFRCVYLQWIEHYGKDVMWERDMSPVSAIGKIL